MAEERDCVVKVVDDHGVEHSVKVRAESVYEATLKGLTRLEKVGWESDGSQVGSVLVEVWEEFIRRRSLCSSGPTNRRARIYETNLPLKTLLCDCLVPAAAQPSTFSDVEGVPCLAVKMCPYEAHGRGFG